MSNVIQAPPPPPPALAAPPPPPPAPIMSTRAPPLNLAVAIKV